MAVSIPFIEETHEHLDWLSTIAIVFDGPKSLSKTHLAVYLRAMRAKNAQELINAFRHWLCTERRFPYPIDIRQLIEQQRLDAIGCMSVRD